MSILKVILHHWNKTTQSYDNFHPETEVSQVTDWNQGIVNTLASTALGGLVNTLTSDSLLAKMIQKVLEATGVKYSLGQNGYVCFGSLVGGLIIQWGIVSVATGHEQGTHNASRVLPLTASEFLQGVASYDYPSGESIPTAAISCDATTVHIGAQLLPGYTNDPVKIRWFGIFK